MKEQFDIAPARKRAGVTAREVEVQLELPLAALGAIEDGRIGIDGETYAKIHTVIQEIAGCKKEAVKCEREAMTSAAI